MELYQAKDRLDGEDSLWIVYPNGEVSVAYASDIRINCIEYTAQYLHRSEAKRFKDAIDPVLVKEWDE